MFWYLLVGAGVAVTRKHGYQCQMVLNDTVAVVDNLNIPAETRRNNNVIITSKRHCNVVLT